MTAADRAKHIRTELKAMFPKTKFSVRSSNYSMGSEVYIHWTDGPTEEAVQNVIDCLAEDLKTLYDIDIDTQYNGIALTRKISKETWEAVRQEVLKEMEERNDPYITELWEVEKRVSWEIEERNFN